MQVLLMNVKYIYIYLKRIRQKITNNILVSLNPAQLMESVRYAALINTRPKCHNYFNNFTTRLLKQPLQINWSDVKSSSNTPFFLAMSIVSFLFIILTHDLQQCTWQSIQEFVPILILHATHAIIFPSCTMCTMT